MTLLGVCFFLFGKKLQNKEDVGETAGEYLQVTEGIQTELETESELESEVGIETEQQEKMEQTKNIEGETEPENEAAPAMEAYRDYLDTLDEQYTYFALKDVTGDGIVELIYYETDNDGFWNIYTTMTYTDDGLKDIMHGEADGSGGIILGNNNCLILFQNGSDYETTYFYIFSENGVKNITTHAEYIRGMYDLEEYFYVNGEECNTEELYAKYLYYGIDAYDLNDVYCQYPEDRFIQNIEPLNFYENSWQEKERVFGDAFYISEIDDESFRTLLGMMDFQRLYGSYFEEGVSLQDWSDEMKLTFLNYYIGAPCIKKKIVSIVLEEASPLTEGAKLDFSNNAYNVVKLSEVNRILEETFATSLESTPSTQAAIYYNGYYFFEVGEFGDAEPWAMIESVKPYENKVGTYIVKARCGMEAIDDEGNIYFEEFSTGGEPQTFVVEKDVQALVSGLKILEWNY